MGLKEIWWAEICHGGKLFEYRLRLLEAITGVWTLVRVSFNTVVIVKGKRTPRKVQRVVGAILLGSAIQAPYTDEHVFRPEWGWYGPDKHRMSAYSILDVVAFDNHYDLGYIHVLGVGMFLSSLSGVSSHTVASCKNEFDRCWKTRQRVAN